MYHSRREQQFEMVVQGDSRGRYCFGGIRVWMAF